MHLTKSSARDIWHHRLGHCRDKLIRESVQHINGDKILDQTRGTCYRFLCAKSKSILATLKFWPPQVRETTKAIWTGLFGPIEQQSHDKSKYCVSLLDDFTGYSLVHFHYLNIETGDAFIEMIKELENLFNSKSGSIIGINSMTVNRVCSNGRSEMDKNFKTGLNRKALFTKWRKLIPLNQISVLNFLTGGWLVLLALCSFMLLVLIVIFGLQLCF